MTEETKGFSRRTVVKGAAWSVPVIAAAVATPLASASIAGASVVWGPNTLSLATLAVLSGTTGGTPAVLQGDVLPSGPAQFTIQNPTPGDLTNLTGRVTIEHQSGAVVLSAKGYGVYRIESNPALVTGRTYNTVFAAPLGSVVETAQDIAIPGTVAGSSNRSVSIDFGFTSGGVLGIAALQTFSVTLSIYSNGELVGSSVATTMTLPVGINLLG